MKDIFTVDLDDVCDRAIEKDFAKRLKFAARSLLCSNSTGYPDKMMIVSNGPLTGHLNSQIRHFCDGLTR
jgi:hypothetical protein